MSRMARTIQANLDIKHLRNRRRANYTLLLKHLKESDVVKPVFELFPVSVTPLYFPVYVKTERKALQQYLASNDIYCPIIWPKATDCDRVAEEVDWIYDNILSIPCDQRYIEEDMERIVNALAEFQKSV